MTASSSAGPGASPPNRTQVLGVLVRVVVNGVVPVLVYVLLRPHVHSDLTALVIGAAIPLVFTVGGFAWRRRLDPVGVIAVICFAMGLLLVLATGGNEVAFKVREDIWTGPLGLAFLVSALVRRPLFLVLLQFLGRRNPDIAERISRPVGHRVAAVATVVIGLVLLVHAVVMIVLALTTDTTTYLAVAKPAGWAVIITGLAPLVIWIRVQARRPR